MSHDRPDVVDLRIRSHRPIGQAESGEPPVGPATLSPALELGALDLRQEVIWASLAAAEVCWTAPIFLALTWGQVPHLPLLLWLGILILMLGYFYVYRALVAAHLSLRLQQGVLVLALLLSMGLVLRFHVYAGAGLRGVEWFTLPFRQLADVAAVMPGAWVTAMLLVYLWARAIHLANRSISADRVGFSFRAGVVILMAAAFFIRIFSGLDLSGFVVPYFFFSLVAVALARIEEVSLMPNSTRTPFGGFWIGSTVGSVAVLVLVGMGVALLFYGGTLRRVLGWLSPLFYVVQILLVGFSALVMFLLEGLMDLLSIDLTGLGDALREAFQRLGELAVMPAVSPPADTGTRPLILAIIQAVLTVGIPLAIITLVVLITWRRLRQGRAAREGEEERESLLSARAVAHNLQAMLRNGLERLGELAGLLGRLGPGSRFLAAISIRRIYANLVRLATEAGYPRSRAQTPYEYLPTLREAFPGGEEAVTRITEAYVNAHYGQVPDSREELQRIRDCWEQVRALEIKKTRPRAGETPS